MRTDYIRRAITHSRGNRAGSIFATAVSCLAFRNAIGYVLLDMLMYRSTGTPGYSGHIRNSPRCRSARKCEREVRVEYATDDCVVQSREGKVHARKGDAILTGAHGERWRVSRARFPEKYRPVPPVQPGEDGIYMSRPIEVLALQMQEAFMVQLADGRSILDGARGNWLVDYGDGSLGIVDPAVFADTYQLTD